jgi:translocation protein SEC63
MEVSIGLPTYFLDPNNRNFILLAYLIVMVGAIPYAVWRYYSDSSKFGEKNIMYETYSWFYHSLSEHATVKTLPEVFAGAAEFRQGETPSKDEMESVMKLVMSMKSMMQKPKTNKKLLRSNALLHAHLLRKHDMLSEKQREDLNNMLRLSTSLNEAMIKICQHQEWLNTALNCIEFSQNITQAVWIKDNSLLQLPHFSDKEVAQCEKAKGAGAAKCLKDYLHVPDDEKKGLSDMSESDKKDVMTACALIPDISVEHDIYVDDDEDNKVYENDLVTIKVTITRNNLKGGEKAGLIHAPLFPFPKKEAWWVILGTKQGKIIHAEKITSPAKVVSHKIKFLAPPKGEYEFDCFIKSNAYSGLDQEFKVNLTTLDASALPEYKVHPDDKNLDDEPTLFEEMMNANVEEESDSEDEDGSDDESEANGIRELSPEERKKQAAKKAQTDDDDSDSDVEEVHVD